MPERSPQGKGTLNTNLPSTRRCVGRVARTAHAVCACCRRHVERLPWAVLRGCAVTGGGLFAVPRQGFAKAYADALAKVRRAEWPLFVVHACKTP